MPTIQEKKLNGFLDVLFMLKDADLDLMQDRSFSDAEYAWTDKRGEDIAWGYHGSDGSCDVSVILVDGTTVVYDGCAAKVLLGVYANRHVSRNDCQ